MDTNERIFQRHQGFIKGPPRSANLDVEDLRRVRWTREIKAGTFYQIIWRWFVNKMQSDRLDVRQRLKHGRDLDLIRYYPAFEVTSLCMFPLWPRSTLTASSLARMKQSHSTHDFDVLTCPHRSTDIQMHMQTAIPTYTHTSLVSLSLTTLRHGKTLRFLINYGTHLWGSTFITYDRSS